MGRILLQEKGNKKEEEIGYLLVLVLFFLSAGFPKGFLQQKVLMRLAVLYKVVSFVRSFAFEVGVIVSS